MQKRFKGEPTPGTDAHVYDSFKSDRKKYGIGDFSEKLSLDPQKKKVFLMSHALSDAPHGDDRMLHNDYYEWFEDTLALIKNIQHVNWIVKPHPDNQYYMDNADAKIDPTIVLANKYVKVYDHIFVAPDDLHTSSIVNLADVIITVRGSAIFEFSTLGIPCVATGKGPFTGLGFAIEPETIEEYAETLNNIDKYERLTQEQIDKAMVCCFIYYYLNFVDCAFLPNVSASHWGGFDLEKYFKSIIESMGTYAIHEDPLYKNFNYQLNNNLMQLMKHDELQAFEPVEKSEIDISEHFQANQLDILANKIAKTVKSEVYNIIIKELSLETAKVGPDQFNGKEISHD